MYTIVPTKKSIQSFTPWCPSIHPPTQQIIYTCLSIPLLSIHPPFIPTLQTVHPKPTNEPSTHQTKNPPNKTGASIPKSQLCKLHIPPFKKIKFITIFGNFSQNFHHFRFFLNLHTGCPCTQTFIHPTIHLIYPIHPPLTTNSLFSIYRYSSIHKLIN